MKESPQRTPKPYQPYPATSSATLQSIKTSPGPMKSPTTPTHSYFLRNTTKSVSPKKSPSNNKNSNNSKELDEDNDDNGITQEPDDHDDFLKTQEDDKNIISQDEEEHDDDYDEDYEDNKRLTGSKGTNGTPRKKKTKRKKPEDTFDWIDMTKVDRTQRNPDELFAMSEVNFFIPEHVQNHEEIIKLIEAHGGRDKLKKEYREYFEFITSEDGKHIRKLSKAARIIVLTATEEEAKQTQEELFKKQGRHVAKSEFFSTSLIKDSVAKNRIQPLKKYMIFKEARSAHKFKFSSAEINLMYNWIDYMSEHTKLRPTCLRFWKLAEDHALTIHSADAMQNRYKKKMDPKALAKRAESGTVAQAHQTDGNDIDNGEGDAEEKQQQQQQQQPPEEEQGGTMADVSMTENGDDVR